MNQAVPASLAGLKGQLGEGVKGFLASVSEQLVALGLQAGQVQRLAAQVGLAEGQRLEEGMAKVAASLEEQQRELSRGVLVPHVAAEMQPAYAYCAAECGSGCFQRMKAHMVKHVGSVDAAMLHGAAKVMHKQLKHMVTVLRDQAAGVGAAMLASITTHFSR